MKVLIVGVTGFIGARLAREFHAAGHEVTGASRNPDVVSVAGLTTRVGLDYTRLPSTIELRRLVTGFDVVINAVGILRERGRQTFAALHDAGPRALFAACAAANVRRVIQVSALGSEAGAMSRYHRSKHAADRALMELPLDWAIVQPSVVFGAGGTSARLFETLASLPLLALPAGGAQRVQPVHIDDVVALVLKLATSPAALHCVVPVVGPRALALREFLEELRRATGHRPALTMPVPRPLVRLAALIGDVIPGSLLDSETLGMLERGNTGDPRLLAEWLGRSPRPVSEFIAEGRVPARRVAASLYWLLPLLRVSVAFMWFIAAIVSMGPYPVDQSLELLRSIGASPAVAPLLLTGAIVLDFAFGVLTLLPWRHRHLWTAQIAVVAVYTLIISVKLPHLWLEPFGPVAKNVPILALLVMLQQLEKRE